MPQFEKEENDWFLRELHPYEPMLRAWLGSRFPSMGDFEDCIQEAYVRTVKRQRNKRLASPKAFLFAIARNICIDALRTPFITTRQAVFRLINPSQGSSL